MELVAACRAAEDIDFRTTMELGALAREAGDLASAAAFYERARTLDPASTAATLDLAVTRELQHDPQAARALYEQVLARDPASRAALLGLARVARSQYKLDEARDLYQRVLKANPDDIEAQNGLAWVALADQKTAEARAGFERVLARDPGNAEAQQGLRGVETTWPYQLDVLGGYVNTNDGHAWAGGVLFRGDLDATRSLELGATHFSNELPSANLTQERPLPSNDIHVGYFVRVPGSYNWALVYDYRDHSTQPTEHWLEARAGSYFARDLQWFASVRASFGADIWDSQLYQAGLVLPLKDGWELGPTVYYQSSRGYQLNGTTVNDGSLWAYGIDLNRQGPGRSFFNVGAGYSPDISNVDTHLRWVWPLTTQGALLVTLQHVTVNHQTQASIGWRFYWR